jgi:predicted DNA-binding transcriptional regulator YafY
MSKRGYITRYLLILKKLKAQRYCSLEELQHYVEKHSDYLKDRDETLNIGFSKRTFQRDIKEIRIDFGVDIDYSRKEKGYFISSGEMDTTNFQRRMEAFDLFNALNLTDQTSAYILLEKRQPLGTDHIYDLLLAVKNRQRIKFSYQKFWEEEITQRHLEPHALKEFKNRWYLIGKEVNGQIAKTFALDRLTNLETTNTHFEYPLDPTLDAAFKYSFGIMGPETAEPDQIILSFNVVQGKYIKTLPLHETQEIILDNAQELRIKLKLFVTYDLIMELMSYGSNLLVLEPASLAQRLKEEHQKAYLQYT